MILSDTSVILHYLKGSEFIIPNRDELFSISVISEMELLGVKNISDEEKMLRKNLVEEAIVYPFTTDIKNLAIELKQKIRIRIPDAVIAATALQFNLTLLTTDKDFAAIPHLSMILLKSTS